MVPNNQLLPKTKAKRKSNRNVRGVWVQQAGLLQAVATKCQYIVKEEVIVGLIKKKREIWKRGSGRNLHQSLQKNLRHMI